MNNIIETPTQRVRTFKTSGEVSVRMQLIILMCF